jgi:hypothetical protein
LWTIAKPAPGICLLYKLGPKEFAAPIDTAGISVCGVYTGRFWVAGRMRRQKLRKLSANLRAEPNLVAGYSRLSRITSEKVL